jgi:branched-chain amino acid transport system ATP-binding protein
MPEMFSWLSQYREFFFGAFVLLILILSPRGLAGIIGRAWDLVAGRRLRNALRKVVDTGTLIGTTPDPAALRLPERPVNDGSVPAVEYSDVTIAYGGNVAVDRLSFSVRPGTIHGIIGPNGAGKTTMLNALTGQVGVVSGRVLVDGDVVREHGGGVAPRRLSRRGVARTFQTPIVIPDRTVLENVKLGLYAFGRSGIIGGTLKSPRVQRAEAEAGRRAAEALALVGFRSPLDTEVSLLGFGDLRKLEIARAIVSDPVVLLLDEPTSGLETDVASEILARLRELQNRSDSRLTIIIVEHNVPLILGHCDDVTAMADGRVIASEPASSIRNNPEVRQSYLGEQLEMEDLAGDEDQAHA